MIRYATLFSKKRKHIANTPPAIGQPTLVADTPSSFPLLRPEWPETQTGFDERPPWQSPDKSQRKNPPRLDALAQKATFGAALPTQPLVPPMKTPTRHTRHARRQALAPPPLSCRARPRAHRPPEAASPSTRLRLPAFPAPPLHPALACFSLRPRRVRPPPASGVRQGRSGVAEHPPRILRLPRLFRELAPGSRCCRGGCVPRPPPVAARSRLEAGEPEAKAKATRLEGVERQRREAGVSEAGAPPSRLCSTPSLSLLHLLPEAGAPTVRLGRVLMGQEAVCAILCLSIVDSTEFHNR